jgi:glutamyl/glutaminyl-tRNA synthetase
VREVPNSAKEMEDDLAWAGLHYDEGPNKPSSVGPFIQVTTHQITFYFILKLLFQSQRLDIYQKHIEILLKVKFFFFSV